MIDRGASAIQIPTGHFNSTDAGTKLYPRYDVPLSPLSQSVVHLEPPVKKKSTLCDVIVSILFFVCLVVFFYSISGSIMQSKMTPEEINNATALALEGNPDVGIAEITEVDVNTIPAVMTEVSSSESSLDENKDILEEFHYISSGADPKVYQVNRDDKVCAFKSCRTLDPHFDKKTIAKMKEVDNQVQEFLNYDANRIARIKQGLETEEDDYNLHSTHGQSNSGYMGDAKKEYEQELLAEQQDTLQQKTYKHKTYIPQYDEGID